MLIGLLLIVVLFVLLWQEVSEKAIRELRRRRGLPHDTRWPRLMRSMLLVLAAGIIVFMLVPNRSSRPPRSMAATYTADSLWMGMDSVLIDEIGGEREDLVRYGRELVRNTAYYLGPQGTVAHLTNGMNCQNCHQQAGTRPWGNNYGAVWSTYPKFRERSGTIETVVKRINDCVERSLNGTALDTNGREMRALLAYMEWVGTGLAKGGKPKGSGLMELPYLDRPADPKQGELLYAAKCARCHQSDGSGQKLEGATTYLYPPLWGEDSYTIGAGLYRLSRFAAYVKNNMPQGITWNAPELTDEQAWDLAAYVNSRARPDHELATDWPRIAGKPVDHPFGPYADEFSEEQHKFGPFGPIAEANKK